MCRDGDIRMNHDWMANDKVDILRHLPEFLRKDGQFKGTNDADSDEHDKMRLALQDLLDQLYVQSATWGLSRWEELLAIETTEGKSDEERRKEIIRRLQKPESVTVEFLERLINLYTSDGSGKVTSHPEDYSVDMRFNAVSREAFASIIHGMRTYLPAHLGLKGKIDYIHNRTLFVGMKRRTKRVVNVYPMNTQKEVFDQPLYLGIAMEIIESLEVK